MKEQYAYFRFMTDIIESGLWAKLSSSAKTLYPVLLKFSDHTFKHVWPSTETLLKLTGFKTKKSLIQAKKELSDAGLLHIINGSGRTSTRYYFIFNYEGSKITPLGYKNIHPKDEQFHTPEVDDFSNERGTKISPNNINITINNTNKEFQAKKKTNQQSIEHLIRDYGADIFYKAYNLSKEKNMENNVEYIRYLCKEMIEINQRNVSKKMVSWESFLDWAKVNVTSSSYEKLLKIDVEFDGSILFFPSDIPVFLRRLIENYFTSSSDEIILLFSDSVNFRKFND